MNITITSHDIERLAQIVREDTGNQVAEKNYPMIESRVRAHVLRLKMTSMDEYWKHFRAHEDQERDALLSLLTTHYTFFFREYVHFDTLEAWLTQQMPRLKSRYEKSGQPVRVWSAACSRGQEVYSLAMFLSTRLSIPYEVVGTDIDAESVAYAKNGVYPLKEVNTIPHQYLAEGWRKGSGAVREYAAATPALKGKVRFEPLNLLEVASWGDSHTYDVIFCRNVFIYFSEENVKRIALNLNARLADEGLFISGVSEPLRFEEWRHENIGPSCYIKKSTKKPAAKISTEDRTPSAASHSTPAPNINPVSPSKSAAGNFRILCVDDSPTIQLLIKKIFSTDPAFAAVEIANNGQEARQKLDKNNYDLVTLDIHMPVVNGIEFMEKLYNKKSDPPVLMISSVNRTDIELATKSLTLGAFDYVEKPAMNNLGKSTTEILTKAKMAIRSKGQPEVAVGSFDSSIARQIVVPDASLCLRAVVSDASHLQNLEQIVRGQGAEYRSPALLIWSPDESGLPTGVEAQMLEWTPRKVMRLRQGGEHLKPNHIYLATGGTITDFFNVSRFKSVSLQVLSYAPGAAAALPTGTTTQFLVDEKLSVQVPLLERQFGRKVSDVTPATSFASLSLEFFANLRKAA